MADTVITAEIKLLVDGYLKKLEEANKHTKSFGERIDGMFRGVTGGVVLGNMLSSLGRSLLEFGRNAIRGAAQMEQYSVAFRVLTRDAGVAQRLMTEIRQLGASTPYETARDLVPAAQQLLGMGVAAGDVVDTLRMIGDVASGLNIPIGDLSYLFGQIRSQGRAMTQDLNQFASRGIPIYATLADMLGTNVAGVRDMAAQGRITFPLIEQAFRRMTSQGGQFYQMMQQQSQTLSGTFSTLQDKINDAAIALGEGMLPALRELVDEINSSPDANNFFRELGRVIGEAIRMVRSLASEFRSLIETFADAGGSNAQFANANALQQENLRIIRGLSTISTQNAAAIRGILSQVEADIEATYTGSTASEAEIAQERQRLIAARLRANPLLAAQIPGLMDGFHFGGTVPTVNPPTGQPGNGNPPGSPTGNPPGGGAHQQTMSTPGADAAGMMETLQASKNAQMQHLMNIDQVNREERERNVAYLSTSVDLAQQWISGLENIYKQDEQNKLASVKRKYSAEADAIKNSTLSEEEKAKKLEELSKRQEAEERRIQRNAAKRQKEMSRYGIIADMAAGVMAAVRAGMVPNLGPVGVALAVAQGATVVALGAKQLEMLEKTPLPELNTGAYFGGSPRGTMAWVGDKNKSEWVLPDEKLRQVVREEAGTQTITTYVMLDGDKVGASVDRYRRAKGYDQSASDYNYRNLR